MQNYSNNTFQKKSENTPNAAHQNQSGTAQFVDDRPEALAQRKIQQLATNRAVAQQAIQMAAVNPVIAGGAKATSVSLNLGAGDHVPQGTIPAADPSGWTELQTLGLTNPGLINARKWVRFHALNEHAGGPGDNVGNLTSATATANHDAGWAAFEGLVKAAIPDGGANAAQPVGFQVNVGYPGGAATHWKNQYGHYQATNAADYPNSVAATLTVNGAPAGNANLNAANGLYGPEAYQKIAGWKRKATAAAAYGDVGTDTHPGALPWT